MAEPFTKSVVSYHAPRERTAESESEMLERVTESVVTVEILLDGETVGHGSGFFVKDGRVATARHVAAAVFTGNVQLLLTLESGLQVPAVVSYMDMSRDFALLQPQFTPGQQAPEALELAANGSTQLAQRVWGIGAPLDPVFGQSAYSGTVTKLPEAAKPGDTPQDAHARKALKSNIGVKGGMSGGPIVNQEGKVVGLTSANLHTPGRTHEGAVDISLAVEDFSVVVEHAPAFEALYAAMFAIHALRGRNEFPARGIEAVFSKVTEMLHQLLNTYCEFRHLAPEVATSVKAALLRDEGFQHMIKSCIGAPVFQHEMVAYNARFAQEFAVTLYSDQEIASAVQAPQIAKAA